MVNVLCANVGWKWHDVWVYRLRNMVSENCSVPFRFICISDHQIDGIHTEPASPIVLDPNKPQGCWAKLDYFRREITGDDPCIALDLDVTILDDIAPLVREKLHSGQDPRTTERYMNSSVLSWTPSAETDAIYTDRIPYAEHPRGDQEFIAKRYPDYGILPDVHSYKGKVMTRKDKTPPEGTRIVFFHGWPTPASPVSMQLPWNARTWDRFQVVERL